MGGIGKLPEQHTLPRGSGETWTEVEWGKLEAEHVSETQEAIGGQRLQIVDVLSIEPTGVRVVTIVTDRVAQRLARQAVAKMGGAAERAMLRMKDERTLLEFGGAGINLGAAGATLTPNLLAAAYDRIMHNPNEPPEGPIRAAGHGYQMRAIRQAIAGNVGNINFGEVSQGLTARIFREGFMGKVFGVETFTEDKVRLDSNDDGLVGVFSRESLVMVNEAVMRSETERVPGTGLGATRVFLRGSYALGVRRPTDFLATIKCDGSAPTA